MEKITITKPDDWHLHLRDGEMLKGVIGDSARHQIGHDDSPLKVPC